MRQISEIVINERNLVDIIESHHLYLIDDESGVKADLSYANLPCADLRGANLSYVNLHCADLSYADLHCADLSYADLRGTDLYGADLSYANLHCADLHCADLSYADLRGADLDFSCLPLCCKGLNFKIDERLAKQLVYHVINIMMKSKISTQKIFKKNVFKWLKDSHLVTQYNLSVLEDEI